MIRLAWRQFRTQAVVTFGALAVVAVVFAITGPSLVHIYDTSVAACRANRGAGEGCVNPVVDKFRNLQAAGPALLLVAPALVGIFWGAPLVARELETGTFRLAFTQSVTRTRWFAVKVGVVGLSSIALAGLLSLVVTWWSSPIDLVNANRFSGDVFDVRGIVPIGYAAFAFALGVTAGMLTRRTVPAMATTMVAFVAARLAITFWVRPHLMAPARAILSLSGATSGVGIGSGPSGPALVAFSPDIPNAWVYSSTIVDNQGRPPGAQYLETACPNLPGVRAAPPVPAGGSGRPTKAPEAVQAEFHACMAKAAATYHEVVTYQPANRYWDLQALETAIFLAIAGALVGVCVWWIRHRVA
jgi:hypothetical protein